MRRNILWITGAIAASLAFSAPAFAKSAEAVLQNSKGKELGRVKVISVPSGVLLDVDLTAFPPGDHAFHIHETGLCEPPDYKSAGGHLNPEEDQHGLMNDAGPHAGDMPNIHVPESGTLHIEVLNQMTNFDGLFDDDGSAIVVHEGPDDYVSDPAGDAGARIACGVITK